MTTQHDAENVPQNVPKRAHAARKTSGPVLPRGITVYRRTMAGGHVSPTYYTRFRVRDKSGAVKQPQLDTGTADYREAVQWAIAQKAALTSGQKKQVLAATMSMDRPNVSRVGQLLSAWEEHQTRAKQSTVIDTLSGFRLVWREALGLPDNRALDAVLLTALTKPALVDWIARRQGLPKADFRRPLPANNTICARLREMRSILSAKHVHLWADEGLHVPDFSAVLAVPMPEPTHRPFRWIESDIMEAMEKAVDASGDENARRGFWLMRLLALRNSEVSACRVGWAERLDGKLFLRLCHRPDEGFALKRRENVRFLEIPEKLIPWFDGPPDKFLLTGSRTERRDQVWRRLNHLLRRFLPDRTKASYELRKQRISEEMVETGNIAAAAALAGDLVATIEMHYCDISANLPALRMRRAKVLEGGAA
jgi:hypothetical protein